MPEERVIFAATFNGLYRAFRATIDSGAEALRQRGIDFSKELHPAYPLPVFLATLSFLAASLGTEGSEDDRVYLVGRQFVKGYSETAIGKAAVFLARTIGPRRMLERLTRQFRSGNNYSETKLTQLDSAQFELWCNNVSFPGWYRGLVTEALRIAGAKDPIVVLTRHTEDGATFAIRWSG